MSFTKIFIIAVAMFVSAEPSLNRSPAMSPAIDSKSSVKPNIEITNPSTNLSINSEEIFDESKNAKIKLKTSKPQRIKDFFQLLINPSKKPMSNKTPSAIETVVTKFIFLHPHKVNI